MGGEGARWGREAGGEVACEKEREGRRREGGEEVGRGGYKCGGRGGRRGRVMKRHPGKTKSKTLAKALLGGNLKLKIAESSLPRNFSCSDFEKFCQECP